MKIVFAMVILVGVLATGTANALTFVEVESGEVWIGCVNHNGTGFRSWICVDDGDDHWHELDTSCDLDDDIYVYSDDAGSSIITMIVSAGTVLSDGCNGTWSALGQDNHFVFLEGGSGDDLISGNSGNNDIRMNGLAGDDTLLTRSTHSSSGAQGFGDNDVVVAINSSSSGDSIAGDSSYDPGDDCVEDRGSGWETFTCGDGADHYDTNGQGNPGGSCGSSVSSCYP